MLPQIFGSAASAKFLDAPKNEAQFSLPQARHAQVSLPMPPVAPSLPAAALAANAVRAAFTVNPALGAAGLVGAAASSVADHIVGHLTGNLPPNVSAREIQMASIAMSDMKISADRLSHLSSEQKAFFVKAAASLVQTQRSGSAPGRDYLAALGMLLDKAGKISPDGIKSITPAEADRMFGLRRQGALDSLPARSSFPGPDANSRRAGEGLLVNPGASDFKLPSDTGQRERTENLSPPFMEAERPKLRGERSEPIQPIGDTLPPTEIRLMVNRLVYGHPSGPPGDGHAWSKHGHEFNDLGITTQQQFAEHLTKVLQNMGLTSQTKISGQNRIVYDPESNTFIRFNKDTAYPQTAFRPAGGAQYYYSQPKGTHRR